MTVEIIVFMLVALVATAVLFELLAQSKPVAAALSGTSAVVPPFIAVVAVVFALFSAANASDIWSRARTLRASVELEASTARSIAKSTEHMGSEAEPLRRALHAYLNAAVTTERDWLAAGQQGAQPAQGPLDELIHQVAVFANTADSAPALKSLIVNRVDDLQRARSDRIARFLEHEALMHWFALLILAMNTQLSISLVHVGKRAAGATAQAVFTFSVGVAFVYLAAADGIIGPSRISEMVLTLEGVRDAMSMSGVGRGQ